MTIIAIFSVYTALFLTLLIILAMHFTIGRFDLHKHHLLCEDCSTVIDPFTIGVLLKSGYWPGSVLSINYLIKEEVFILWDTFRKRMPGSSERAFLMSLNDISNDNGRVS